jgi:AAA15 family ATPase/GTPase
MTLIKLSAFRIKNFRSIKDSGWRTLATDNISILIGQNESGKTSVLEALQSFYDQSLNEDVLRSDNCYPEISCRFRIESNTVLSDLLSKNKLPSELHQKTENQKEFTLTRKWSDIQSNVLTISSDEIYEFYTNKLSQDGKIEEQNIADINGFLSESEVAFKELETIEKEKNELQAELKNFRKELEAKQKVLRRARKPDQKLIAEKDAGFALQQFESKEKEFKKIIGDYEKIKIETQELTDKLTAAKNYQNASTEQIVLQGLFEESQKKLIDLEHIYELSTRDKIKRNTILKLKKQRIENNRLKAELKQANHFVNISLLVAIKVFRGTLRFKQAEDEAKKEIKQQSKYYTLEDIGRELFEHIPVFEFFEDFGGLLPNKIDLEDLLNDNSYIEGFKATWNFLKIAGLDTSFFMEKNQRILKQRIETLNSDVTVDFQDYWSQKVGKGNKIRLHFELEHYDYTVPEKSGKPYLEFWIKDSQERLYPKQRSRGVRWFLSFYLELKATAVDKKTNRVILIDEPGLSLHARAQEDVLKVFEDLRKEMQIIYCTHSPHLIKPEKLHRILAVQRSDENDDKSETLLFEPDMLSKVSADTLTPLYSVMGVRLSNQQFVREHNIIVQDVITYCYLNSLCRFMPEMNDLHFIPATNIHTIPVLVNILAGWQLGSGVVLFGSDKQKLVEELQEETLLKNTEKSVKVFTGFQLVEDVFSAVDFKKYVLLKRVGIVGTNSQYISTNNLSRNILATNFVNKINDMKFRLDDFDELTRENIRVLFQSISLLI